MSLKLHDYKLDIAVTGGGSLFISDRLTEGGASAYLLEAHVPYATAALDQFLGRVREKYCSGSTARQMALACYQRGLALGETKTIGVGVTCSLAKPDGEREGRVHEIFIALVHKHYVVEIAWTDAKKTYANIEGRAAQETFASGLIKNALEIFVECLTRNSHKDETSFQDLYYAINNDFIGIKVKIPGESATEAIRSININKNSVRVHGLDCFVDLQRACLSSEPICIYPGSFNPWHVGHQEIWDACQGLFGKDHTFLELSVMNFDKPGIEAIELEQRLGGVGQKNTLITGLTKFVDKFRSIPKGNAMQVVFAVGTDTFERINLDDFAGLGLGGEVKFLVFPRGGKTINHYSSHPWLVHPESYNLKEGTVISSTELRKRKPV